MTLDEIKAEMARKPDAHLLLEWLDGELAESSRYPFDPNDRLREAIDAYFTGAEAE